VLDEGQARHRLRRCRGYLPGGATAGPGRDLTAPAAASHRRQDVQEPGQARKPARRKAPPDGAGHTESLRMIVTTTPSVEGFQIAEYKGIIVGEAILGANLFRDIFAGITDIMGGRSGSYEGELAKARATALSDLEERAAELGANAVVGVDLDYEVINNMMMVTASGTAVRLG
jgi:uncharacterized protein YbjQ (UPF0145 family)